MADNGIEYKTVHVCPICFAAVEPKAEQCPYCKAPFDTDKPEVLQPQQITKVEQQLAQILTDLFSISELETLLFYLGVNHENLIAGMTRTKAAQEIATEFFRTGRIPQLFAQIRRERPRATFVIDIS